MTTDRSLGCFLNRVTALAAATGARLSLSGGLATQTYQIQATTNLRPVSWQAIGTAEVSGALQFLDSDAKNYPARFYRVIVP